MMKKKFELKNWTKQCHYKLKTLLFLVDILVELQYNILVVCHW